MGPISLGIQYEFWKKGGSRLSTWIIFCPKPAVVWGGGANLACRPHYAARARRRGLPKACHCRSITTALTPKLWFVAL